jgi:hypothetical protein
MDAEETKPGRDPAIARRRTILFSVGAMAVLLLAVVALIPLLKADPKPKTVKPPEKPVIVARIEMKATKNAKKAHGLGELIHRGDVESLRVLVSGLPANRKNEAYQLMLAGGENPEKLLGTVVVGDQGIFVGEAKVGFEELKQFKRLQLRRVTRGDNPTAELVSTGRVPN